MSMGRLMWIRRLGWGGGRSCERWGGGAWRGLANGGEWKGACLNVLGCGWVWMEGWEGMRGFSSGSGDMVS